LYLLLLNPIVDDVEDEIDQRVHSVIMLLRAKAE
jgi:hypothetical protein